MIEKRRYLFFTAGALILIAIVWTYLLNVNSTGSRICEEINQYGYRVQPEDLYAGGTFENATVRSLLPDMNLEEAAALSAMAGYPSDVDRRGTVELILANVESEDVVTLYYVDGALELAFLQVNGTEELRSLSGN